MLPSRCDQLPCMNIDGERRQHPALADRMAGALDLARLVGELVDRSLQIGELVEHPDEHVRRDQRDRDERERPRRHVVAERQHARDAIPLESAHGSLPGRSERAGRPRVRARRSSTSRSPSTTTPQTLPRLAAHFYRQAVEERNHAMMIVQYLLDADERVAIPGVEAPQTDVRGRRRARSARARAGEARDRADLRSGEARADGRRPRRRAVPALVPAGAARGDLVDGRAADRRRALARQRDADRGLPRARGGRGRGRGRRARRRRRAERSRRESGWPSGRAPRRLPSRPPRP